MENTQYIVVYRPHNKFNLDTQYYGPFTYEQAEDKVESLGALGSYVPDDLHNNPGVKYIVELVR